MNPEIKKTPWTLEEDIIILELHSKNGSKWAEMAKALPGRYSIFFGDFAYYSSRCYLSNLNISNLCIYHYPRRTDNAIKNHWNSTMRRRVVRDVGDHEGEDDNNNDLVTLSQVALKDTKPVYTFISFAVNTFSFIQIGKKKTILIKTCLDIW